MFKEISVRDLNENFIKDIADEWMLITAGNEEKYNTMTASWGFAGEMWGADAVAVFIRPQRYTREFVMNNDYFTVSFYGDNKKIHSVCGSMSGRDTDKAALAGLTPCFDSEAPYFAEARLVFVCKKQYVGRIEKSGFTDKAADEKWYAAGDYHEMIIGKIEKVFCPDFYPD